MRRLCVSMRLWTATECLCCSVIKMSDEGSNKNSAVGRLCQWSDDLTPTLSFFFFFFIETLKAISYACLGCARAIRYETFPSSLFSLRLQKQFSRHHKKRPLGGGKKKHKNVQISHGISEHSKKKIYFGPCKLHFIICLIFFFSNELFHNFASDESVDEQVISEPLSLNATGPGY